MSDLKRVYKVPSLENAEFELSKLDEKWEKRYPLVVRPWKTNWANASTYFKYAEHIRKIVYTTNAVESSHRQPVKS